MPARANIDGRSKELTKNLMTTRHQLENHFKSIKRREVDFKKQKLVNIEEELKATARMAKRIEGFESNNSQKTPELDKHRKLEREAIELEIRQREQLTKTWSGSGSTGGLGRSWSCPSPSSQFPAQWGGHGSMPKPPGSPAAFPLAVSRHCADVPAAQHPPPHPGSQSMRPAQTRSMAAFATSHTAAFFPPPSSPPRMVPATPPSPGYATKRSPKEADDELSFAAAGNSDEIIEKDPMIKRLGHYMALLGPRYKTISKELIWEKAEMGERTPFQRRLQKAGGIEAVGGGPDRSLRASSVPGELSDSDGKARAAWLAARTSEKDRRNRAARASAPR